MKLSTLKKELLKLDLEKFNNFDLDYGTIINARQFVELHISFLEANSGNMTYICYYKRLLEFYLKVINHDS